MKRKWLILILALIPMGLAPATGWGQIAPDRGTRPETADQVFKYQFYAGFGYTSLNQVTRSRHGLIGVNVAASRNFGRYFAITADGAFYPKSFPTGNPGNPSVSLILGGPELHAPLYGHVSGFFHGLLGGEHTGGEGMTPRISFAGGLGGGLEYQLSPRLVIRASGDEILASFSVANNSPQLGNSPHMTANGRASIGIAYRF